MKHSGLLTLNIGGEGERAEAEQFYLVKAPKLNASAAPAIAKPSVTQAISDVIKAYDRLERAHHSRDERAARTALEKAARKLRLAANATPHTQKSKG
ncbi:hypothetical protein HGP17_25555 [Rhizobium sp. P38BS-XIX]|uniref:hypothetical protein n=1 Tax=Rhizobium sp. P38BS-XIX TaxID=2726740 RepID=UPI0014565579|nr:hypothetical protein [Rhizobium sp. P38BS-XIX]NLS00206.1 hypothetical protein [Rhizobium sp. P38BS-XIX]